MENKTFIESEFLPFMEGVAIDLQNLLPDLKFRKDNPQHLYSICLYCSILSLGQSCLLLVLNKYLIPLRILLRSLVEAHVDLINSINDPYYFKKMYLVYLAEKKRLLSNAMKNPDNPFFEYIRASMNLEEEIQKIDEESNQIKTKAIRSLNVAERFSQANLTNQYQVVYWNLCLDAHNNARALERRHIRKKGDNFEIILEDVELSDNWLTYFDTLLGILIGSSIEIHAFLETKTDKYFSELQEKFNELRKRYPVVAAPKVGE